MDTLNSSNLQEYNIQILDSVVLPIQPSLIIFLKKIDTSELTVMMLRRIYRADYEQAIELIEILKHFVYDENSGNNNLGFAYLCKGDLTIAKKYFDNVKNKEFTSLCNLAYLSYLENLIPSSEQYLKRASKSLKTLNPSSPTFSVMHQILVPVEKRKCLPKNFDVVFEPSCELIIEGNKAIIASFAKQNHGFSLLNKASTFSDLDKFYKARYDYFICYNLGDFERAIEKLNKLKEVLADTSYRDHFLELMKMDETILNKHNKLSY